MRRAIAWLLLVALAAGCGHSPCHTQAADEADLFLRLAGADPDVLETPDQVPVQQQGDSLVMTLESVFIGRDDQVDVFGFNHFYGGLPLVIRSVTVDGSSLVCDTERGHWVSSSFQFAFPVADYDPSTAHHVDASIRPILSTQTRPIFSGQTRLGPWSFDHFTVVWDEAPPNEPAEDGL